MSAYAGSDPDSVPIHAGRNLYQGNIERVDKAIIKTLSAMASVVALTYCHQNGREFTPADPQGSFVENFVRMMGFFQGNSKQPDRKIVQHLEKLWILFADHEMTNSTAAFLHAASTLADPISCSVAALASGWGPIHAGAIDMAYKTLGRVGTPDKVPELIVRVKAGKERLYGYGHRIYKTVDPRTKFIQNMMGQLSAEVKRNPLLAVALEIDRVASEDEYFTSRHLKANADLYGCFVYTALYVLPFVSRIDDDTADISRTADSSQAS